MNSRAFLLLEQDLANRWLLSGDNQRLELALTFLRRGYELGRREDEAFTDETPDDNSDEDDDA